MSTWEKGFKWTCEVQVSEVGKFENNKPDKISAEEKKLHPKKIKRPWKKFLKKKSDKCGVN